MRDPELAGPPLGRATGILILLVAAVFALGLQTRTSASHRAVATLDTPR